MTEKNHAEEQASAQFQSIERMVNALDLDWDRLEELRDMEERDAEEEKELQELQEIAGDWNCMDDAVQAIQEDPLEVQVRSDWTSPGHTLEPSEFCILLCTGGPAVRIVGELDQSKQPCRAWIEYQDWGTPWTQYFGANEDVLLRYCEQFFYGE